MVLVQVDLDNGLNKKVEKEAFRRKVGKRKVIPMILKEVLK